MDFDTINARRKPREATTWILLDHDLVVRVEELRRRVRDAEVGDQRENRIPQAPALRAELERLEQQIEDAAVAFRFRALPRREYRALLDDHKDDTGEKRWDTETFPPALIAACAVDPEMTLEQAQTVYSEWDDNQAFTLFSAALMVNEGESKVPFTVRSSAATSGSEQS